MSKSLRTRPNSIDSRLGRVLEISASEENWLVTKSGFKWIYLDTTDPQIDAVKLYEKMGFTKTEKCGIIHNGIIGPFILEAILSKKYSVKKDKISL